jgi:hypothetical protein
MRKPAVVQFLRVGKPIAVQSQSILRVSAINPLVAFYDIHGRKGEVLFFCFGSDTTREITLAYLMPYHNLP